MSTIRSPKVGYTYTVNEALEVRTCPVCHISYAIPQGMYEAARRGQIEHWYCPNGHNLVPSAGTYDAEARRLAAEVQRERTRTQAVRDQLEATERSRRAQKGQVTKIKRRVAKGVCPCCNRQFVNLHRHMENQHPDFVPGSVPSE